MGDLDTTIYMDCPMGMDHEDEEVVLLNKTVDGLVQSARLCNHKFAKTMIDLWFEQCKADPCLFKREKNGEPLYILTYVDDNLTIGSPRAMKELIEEVRGTEFTITIEENLKDYLSCEILRMNDGMWLGQPHMIKKLNKEFNDEIKTKHVFRTPGAPGLQIVKPKEDELMLPAEQQSRYRTGAGMLLFLVKHSQIDIMNPV